MNILLMVVLGVILFIAGGSAAALAILRHRNQTYWNYTQTAGEVEKKYTALGPYEVSETEFDAPETAWQKYKVWYPSNMEDSQTYPLVVMANGTGMKASKYKEVFRHLASWGFIAAGNEDENSRTGESSAATLDFMLEQNTNPDSLFHQKIDKDHVGITGHSQGGVGAVHAVTDQENGYQYKAIWAASPTSRAVAEALNILGDGWTMDVSKVKIPLMLVAGTGKADAGTLNEYTTTVDEGESQGISPLWWLLECFHAVSDNIPVAIARRTGKDHGDMLRCADGYMTAWFCWWLKSDTQAGRAFTGNDRELAANPNWQDVKIKLPAETTGA